MSAGVIVTGASGMLGRAVCKELQKNSPSWLVQGLAWSRATGDLLKVDVTDRSSVRELFQHYKPKFIIHCAAERRPDVMAKNVEAARKLNIDATRNVCEEATAVNATVIYISTDYVFDGTSAPYNEDDQTNPLNEYGLSKLEGEKIALSVNSSNVVLRVAILYGFVESPSESAVTTLLSNVIASDVTCPVDNVQRRFPTHCDDVAVVIRQLLDKRSQDDTVCGVFHWSGNECMTKYDMSVAIGCALGLPVDHLLPDNSQPSASVTRPYDAQLTCKRLEALGVGRRTVFRDGITECLKLFV